MSQNLAKIEAFKVEGMPLEQCLAELEKYGNPNLHKNDKTWSCNVEVFVTGEGTEFKVRSGYNCKTIREASNLCYARLMAELKRIKETN